MGLWRHVFLKETRSKTIFSKGKAVTKESLPLYFWGQILKMKTKTGNFSFIKLIFFSLSFVAGQKCVTVTKGRPPPYLKGQLLKNTNKNGKFFIYKAYLFSDCLLRPNRKHSLQHFSICRYFICPITISKGWNGLVAICKTVTTQHFPKQVHSIVNPKTSVKTTYGDHYYKTRDYHLLWLEFPSVLGIVNFIKRFGTFSNIVYINSFHICHHSNTSENDLWNRYHKKFDTYKESFRVKK